MSLQLTRDGTFYPDGEINVHNGRLKLAGTLLVQADYNIYGDPNRTKVLGRSGQAQLGLDINAPDFSSTEFRSDRMEVPVELTAYGGFQLLDEIMELVASEVPIKVGRLLSLNNTEPLNEEGLRKAIDEFDIMCKGDEGDDWRVNEDGSISVKLDAGAFVQNHRSLEKNGAIKQVLMHGRDGMNRVQDFIPESSRVIKPNELFIGGIRFSTGKYSALIRPDVSDQILHLNGGLFLDAFRSTRLDERYEGSARRQVELVNRSGSSIEKSSLWITIDIYPSHRDKGPVPANFNTKANKIFMHEHGVSFVQATSLELPEVRELLFSDVSVSNDEDLLYGRVITRNGVTPIEWSETDKFQNQDTITAVENEEGKRSTDDRFEAFIEGLGETKDQGRVLVTNGLPTSDQLRLLVNRGVRSFIFKEVRPRSKANKTKNHESRNIYLDPHLHQELTKLEADGVSFSFICEVESGEEDPVREFYKGFWCKPESKQKLDSIEIVIDMYGWHKDKVSDMCEEEVREFFTGLIEIHGKEKIAVATGIGPGFMDLADRIAKQLGIFRFGVGIDVEEKGQAPSVNTDAMLHFDSAERGYRQKILDELGVAKIFNIGGFGTSEETWITCCSTKLGEYMPMPLLFIDGSEGEHLWANNKKQAQVIAGTTEFRFGDDEEVVDLSDYKSRLGNAWVDEVLHCVDSYTEAMKIWSEFVSDPVSYWEAAGIPRQELLYAFSNHLALAKKLGRPMPSFLKTAMEKLEKDSEKYDAAVALKWGA